jgi:hypothetical protein
MPLHGPTYAETTGGDCPDGSCSGAPRIVTYEATGAEVPGGFVVPIGAELAAADYAVGYFGSPNAAWVPQFTFPEVGRTTTQFTAQFSGDELPAGAVYQFQIVES